MQVKLRSIVESEKEMDRLFSGHPRAKVGFELAVVRRKITPLLEEYHSARIELLKMHGTRDEENLDRYHFSEPQSEESKKVGEPRKVDASAMDAYNDEIKELLKAVVDVDCGISIVQVDKAKIEPMLTPNELAKLWWLITDFQEG